MKYLSFLVLTILLACSTSSETVAEIDTPEDIKSSDQQEMYCADIVAFKDLPDSLKMARTTIINYKKTGNCICITYQYSGCTKGETLLSYDSKFQKGNRPEVNMKLGVIDAGLCEQLLTDSACFSMKKMQLIGNEVLVFLNEEENNLLLNFNGTSTD